MTDTAPTVNVMGNRIASSGDGFAIEHSFVENLFITWGTTNVFLYCYEQSDFLNNRFENAGTGNNLVLSSVNTLGYQSPYHTFTPSPSMTKVNISGARTTFTGTGKQIWLDQGSSESIYTISLRDAYVNMGNNSQFIYSNGTAKIKNITVDTVYVETGDNQEDSMVSISGQASDWHVINANMYNQNGYTVSPFIFSGGVVSSYLMVDVSGQAAGHSNPVVDGGGQSCIGTVLNLGSVQPRTNCMDMAAIYSSFTLGIGSDFPGNQTYTAINGPENAPTGACVNDGAWVFSKDGHATLCTGGTWTTKI